LEGDRAENRCSTGAGIEEMEATEPEDDLRNPVNEMDSRLILRGGGAAGGPDIELDIDVDEAGPV
jgi:hypothetical protein